MKDFARLICCFVLLVFSGQGMAAPSKQIRDWGVSCQPDLTCSVSTAPQSDGIWVFGFERGPEANAKVRFFVNTRLQLTAETEILAAVEGAPDDKTHLLLNPQLKSENLYVTDAVSIDFPLFEAMKKGSKLLLNIQTTEGQEEAILSLSGTGAAFLFLDEAQKRVGNQDALVAKGEGVATTVYSREATISTDAILPKPVLAIWKSETVDCDADGQDLTSSYGGTSVKLKDNAVLYILPCGLPGAYNLISTVYLYDTETKKVRTLGLPVMGERGPIVLDSIYNVSWNDSTNTLSSFYKGRGLGDCGEASTWILNGEDIYSGFELIEQRSKDDCDGQYNDWPIVWPLKKQ